METQLETAKNERKAQQIDTDHLKRMVELANLCRPLHRNHALAFTMADTTSGGPERGGSAGAGGAAAKAFVPASLVMVRQTHTHKHT